MISFFRAWILERIYIARIDMEAATAPREPYIPKQVLTKAKRSAAARKGWETRRRAKLRLVI